MNAKHTPGPWDWDAQGQNGHNGLFNIYILDSTKRKIGTLYGRGDEREANGRLIAAAPEMLEALELLVEEAREDSQNASLMDAFQKARAAIARATGDA